MTKVMIAGYTFSTIPSYGRSNGERNVTIDVPIETETSVLNELQAAEVMEITDPLGREVIAEQRMIGWRSIQTFRAKNKLQYLITWAIPDPDITEKLKKQIEELEIQNENLIEVILDLAAYVGGEKEAESHDAD